MNQYYVYIMSSHHGTLYIGMTNDLYRRTYEHRHKLVPGFTQKYNVTKLVYYEETSSVESAITREKQIIRMAQKQEGRVGGIVESVLGGLGRGLV